MAMGMPEDLAGKEDGRGIHCGERLRAVKGSSKPAAEGSHPRRAERGHRAGVGEAAQGDPFAIPENGSLTIGLDRGLPTRRRSVAGMVGGCPTVGELCSLVRRPPTLAVNVRRA